MAETDSMTGEDVSLHDNNEEISPMTALELSTRLPSELFPLTFRVNDPQLFLRNSVFKHYRYCVSRFVPQIRKDFHVRRRFSDFEALALAAIDAFPQLLLPGLPAKAWWTGMESSDQFLGQRSRRLEGFLLGLMRFQPQLTGGFDFLKDFLCQSSEDFDITASNAMGQGGPWSPTTLMLDYGNLVLNTMTQVVTTSKPLLPFVGGQAMDLPRQHNNNTASLDKKSENSDDLTAAYVQVHEWMDATGSMQPRSVVAEGLVVAMERHYALMRGVSESLGKVGQDMALVLEDDPEWIFTKTFAGTDEDAFCASLIGVPLPLSAKITDQAPLRTIHEISALLGGVEPAFNRMALAQTEDDVNKNLRKNDPALRTILAKDFTRARGQSKEAFLSVSIGFAEQSLAMAQAKKLEFEKLKTSLQGL